MKKVNYITPTWLNVMSKFKCSEWIAVSMNGFQECSMRYIKALCVTEKNQILIKPLPVKAVWMSSPSWCMSMSINQVQTKPPLLSASFCQNSRCSLTSISQGSLTMTYLEFSFSPLWYHWKLIHSKTVHLMPLYSEIVFFLSFTLIMISDYPKKLCLSHHIIEMSLWTRKD